MFELYQSLLSSMHSFTNELAQGDSIAKGLITVGLLGAIVALGRNIPKHIAKYAQRTFTVSVKAEATWSGDERSLYNVLGSFVAENQVKKNYMSRIKSSDEDEESSRIIEKGDIHINPDYSSGIFFFKGMPFYYNSSPPSEQGAVKANITVSTIGRNIDVIWNACNIYERLNNAKSERKYYISSKEDWNAVGTMGKPGAIFLPKETKDKLDAAIDFYVNNRDWYENRGIARKLLIVLYGPPGTGKSRIARYVADRIGYSLATMSDGFNFSSRLRSAASKNIVVSIPDFDALNIASSRTEPEDDDSEESKSAGGLKIIDDIKATKSAVSGTSAIPNITSELQQKTLAEVLNVFQGDIPLKNSVVVMSTNHIEKIDPALLRKGRTDLLIEIGPLGKDEVNAFYKHHYETIEDAVGELDTISIKACDLTAAFQENAFDKDGFIKDIDKFIKRKVTLSKVA